MDKACQDIRETALRLAGNAEGLRRRFFVSKIAVGKEPRIKVLRGFRGTGKTTALLQLMGKEGIYFSMDNPHAAARGFYSLGKAFLQQGYSVLLVDEVHYCRDWKRDAKALYDEFPNAAILVSGSAPLAFTPERRNEAIEVEPLSLREFAELGGRSISASEGWNSVEESIKLLAENPWLHGAYSEYAEGGAFPTYFSYREKTLESVYSGIMKSVMDDAIFLPRIDGAMIVQMQKALLFLATSSLGEFSINSLSKTIEMEKNKAYYMVSILEQMRILRLVRPYGRGAKLVRGEPKLMFYHPVLRKALCRAIGKEPDRGALREETAVFFLKGRGWNVSTIKGVKRNPDYIIEKGGETLVVEIGGDSKKSSQLRGFEEKTLLICEKQLIALGLF